MEYNKYAVVPSTVLLNPDLNSHEKLLMAIINSLTSNEGYCYASNDYLGKIFLTKDKEGNITQKNDNTISRYLNKLEKVGLIERKDVKGNRRIYVMDSVTMEPIEIKHKTETVEEDIDWDKLEEIYNKYRRNLPALRNGFTDTMKKHIRGRIKDYDKDTVVEVFKLVNDSKFLQGEVLDNEGNPKFMANISWIIQKSNFEKILNKNYNSVTFSNVVKNSTKAQSTTQYGETEL